MNSWGVPHRESSDPRQICSVGENLTSHKQWGTRGLCGYLAWSKVGVCGGGQCHLSLPFKKTVEINEDHSNENKQKIFSACIWQTLKGRKERRKAVWWGVGEEGEVFRHVLTRSCQHGGARGGLSRSKASYVIGLGTYLAFSGRS